MDIEPGSRDVATSVFPHDFVRRYEVAIKDNNDEETDMREDLILDKIKEMPQHAALLYNTLAESEEERARLIAAMGIRLAFKCDPDIGGPTWNILLNDPSHRVAEAAYYNFSAYMADIENGQEHDRNDLGLIHGGQLEDS